LSHKGGTHDDAARVSRDDHHPALHLSALPQASQVRRCSARPSPGLWKPLCSRHGTAEAGVFAIACPCWTRSAPAASRCPPWPRVWG